MCNFLIRSFLTPSSHSIILILAVRSCSFRIQTRQIGPDRPQDIPLSYLLLLAILSRFSRQYIASALRHASHRQRKVKVKAVASVTAVVVYINVSALDLCLSFTTLGIYWKATFIAHLFAISFME